MAERVSWPPDDEDGVYDPEELLPKRKPPKLTRRRRNRRELVGKRPPRSRELEGGRPEPGLDVHGLLPESEYWALKIRVFRRAGLRCERCGTGRRQLTPHHRKLLSQSGQDAAENLAALCPQCHDWVHGHPHLAHAAGWIVQSWADPGGQPMLIHTGELVLLGADGTYTARWRP